MLVPSKDIESNPELKNWIIFVNLSGIFANDFVKTPLIESFIKSIV